MKPPSLRPESEDGPSKQLEPWPEHVGSKDLWGEPLDTKSANFDNIADVQGLSTTVMEGYLSAASEISAGAKRLLASPG